MLECEKKMDVKALVAIFGVFSSYDGQDRSSHIITTQWLKKLHDPKAFQNSKLAFSKELMKIPSLKNNPNSKLQTVMAFLNNGSKNKH
jgi:hypothetical protein